MIFPLTRHYNMYNKKSQRESDDLSQLIILLTGSKKGHPIRFVRWNDLTANIYAIDQF